MKKHFIFIKKEFKCLTCGETEKPHKANGLCEKCYKKLRYHKNKKTVNNSLDISLSK